MDGHKYVYKHIYIYTSTYRYMYTYIDICIHRHIEIPGSEALRQLDPGQRPVTSSTGHTETALAMGTNGLSLAFLEQL